MNMRTIREKDRRYGIGLMSGSSCDGIDAALIRIKGTGERLRVKLLDYRTMRFPPTIRARLLAPAMDVRETADLNLILGELFAEAALAVIQESNRSNEPVSVDFVGSHGHTVMHVPPREGGVRHGTLQIGDPAVIAQRTGLPVAANFRTRDMAAGGQGAPLTAYADWVLFGRRKEPAVCLNIGGIANVTVATPALEDVIAFDTGPGNMPIDGAVRHFTNGQLQFDKNGRRAARGDVIHPMLDQLLEHPFFAQAPPKSTGKEEFGFETYLARRINTNQEHTADDIIATITEAVAQTIVDAQNKFVLPNYPVKDLIVSGGGAHNRSLMKRIQDGLPELRVYASDAVGLPGDVREAIAFAVLGNELFCGSQSNVPSATGAGRGVVLGSLTFP